MKVVATEISDSEISSEIELDLEGLPPRVKSRVKKDVGEFLVEQTLLSLGKAESPVKGAGFKSTLSKEYKKFKVGEGRGSKADLEFEGDLKDSFKFIPTESGIKLGHFKAKEVGKADGHNNFSGKSDLPERRYLPFKNEEYENNIQSEIERIVADARVSASPIPEAKLEAVETKTQFWDLLTQTFEGLSRSEIRSAIMRNETLVDRLNRLGFLIWLK